MSNVTHAFSFFVFLVKQAWPFSFFTFYKAAVKNNPNQLLLISLFFSTKVCRIKTWKGSRWYEKGCWGDWLKLIKKTRDNSVVLPTKKGKATIFKSGKSLQVNEPMLKKSLVKNACSEKWVFAILNARSFSTQEYPLRRLLSLLPLPWWMQVPYLFKQKDLQGNLSTHLRYMAWNYWSQIYTCSSCRLRF